MDQNQNSEKMTNEMEERMSKILQERIKNLEAERNSLQSEVDENNDFMVYMAESLAQLPCCCEAGTHGATPPMMWPELISCIVKKVAIDTKSEELRKSEKFSKKIQQRLASLLKLIGAYGPVLMSVYKKNVEIIPLDDARVLNQIALTLCRVDEFDLLGFNQEPCSAEIKESQSISIA